MNKKKDRYLFTISSFITCIVLLMVSIAAMPKIYTPDAVGYLLRLSYPVGMCIVFYANYYWLAPSYYSKKKFGKFIVTTGNSSIADIRRTCEIYPENHVYTPVVDRCLHFGLYVNKMESLGTGKEAG